ncbi:MAG: adenylyltransferase/cytidyltransferase family protein [Candidatus Paceibacterota bacterium]
MIKKRQKIVAISGGMDPIHIGHVRLIKDAKKLGDKLVVILNNDNWLKKKKGHIFMHQDERREIVESLASVDMVVLTNHGPNPKDMSVSKELIRIKPDIFANGGDRTATNIPEAPTCKKIGCEMVFGVGQGGKIQSSSRLLAQYTRSIKAKKLIDVEKTLEKITKAMSKSKIDLPILLKKRLSRLILNLMNRRDGFGLFVILGWEDKWNQFTDMPDSQQDIYTKHHVNVMEAGKKDTHYDIESTVNFDGAILIDKKGNILHSGIIIEGLRPHVIADKIHPGKFKDLSDQFGFKGKVHSRHLSAITASYIFKRTTIFTVSEENDSFHIFENGKIIYQI